MVGLDARCITEEVAPVSVLLAVSDSLQLALLLRTMRRDDSLVVVGTAQDGGQAFDAILEAAPDVAVVDTGLPTVDGLALCRGLRGAHVGTRVLLLDGDPPVTRDRVVDAGAAGCLPATATTAQLCDAIASIANGGAIFYE
jgi:DNA-binding NarL/FixJ family response regulator